MATSGMAGIAPHENTTLIAITIDKIPMQDSINTVFSRHEYDIVDNMFVQDRMQLTGGKEVKEKIELSADGTANRVKSYEEVDVSSSEEVFELSMTLRGFHKAWVLETEELEANTASEYAHKVMDIAKLRRLNPIKSICATIQQDAWQTPQSVNDDRSMNGFPYWLSLANAGVTEPGFYGQTVRYGGGSTGTTIGGISAADQSMWRNFTAPYTKIDATIFEKMSRIYHQLKFQPPMQVSDLVKAPYYDYKIYMGLEQILKFEQIARNGGDAFGTNLDMDFASQLTYRRIPLKREESLESASYNPIYWLNLAYFEPFIRKGWWFRETVTAPSTNLPHVHAIHVDVRCNIRCTNRRHGGAVLHNPIPA